MSSYAQAWLFLLDTLLVIFYFHIMKMEFLYELYTGYVCGKY